MKRAYAKATPLQCALVVLAKRGVNLARAGVVREAPSSRGRGRSMRAREREGNLNLIDQV